MSLIRGGGRVLIDVVGVGLIVLVLVAAVVASHASATPSADVPVAAPAEDHGAGNSSDAQPTAADCSLIATATPPDDHGRPADFPPSKALPPSEATTSVGAVDAARQAAGMFGGTTAAPVTALAAVREMSFAAFRAISGWPENTYINPQRCVWVVTVHAPMAVKVPPGASPRSVDVYSIVFDVASGTMIALMEGTKLVD